METVALERIEPRPHYGPFEPAFDLVLDGEVLATVFYDEKPECAFASVEMETDDGRAVEVPGAEAGLSDDPVGWSLQFSDEPEAVHSLGGGVPADVEPAMYAATHLLRRRFEQRRWEPWSEIPGFRIWESDPQGEG